MLDLLSIQTTSANPALLSVIYSSILSFLISSALGFTYVKTFSGLSFSRNYVQALILGSITTAMVMQAIGDSLARGLGMIGALAIIRFRTNFKDPRDIIFMFASLAAGIGCGVGAYPVAVVGSTVFILAVVILHIARFNGATYYDGMLRFSMDNTPESRASLENVMAGHCKVFALVTLRDVNQGTRLEYAYHVKLKKNTAREAIVNALQKEIPSVLGLSLMMQENTIEL